MENISEQNLVVEVKDYTKIDIYTDILYQTKKDNLDSIVVAKYFNNSVEILENDTKEIIREKIFFNLYNSLLTIKKDYPFIMKLIDENYIPTKKTKIGKLLLKIVDKLI